jgi:hypothetical protein
MFKFGVYNFHTNGYTVGFLTKEIVELCREVIAETPWTTMNNDTHVQYSSWNILPDDGHDDYYQEILRDLKSLNCAPPKLKYIGDCILSLPYFDSLKQSLVKPQHKNHSWSRSLVPHGYGIWNRQSSLQWHSDINDGSSMTILAYFTKDGQDWDRDWNGQLLLGVENAYGNVDQVYEHYPVDGTFVVINNTNPLFKHSVIKSAEGIDRYTMSFRYSIK